jgi:hypothetical protein
MVPFKPQITEVTQLPEGVGEDRPPSAPDARVDGLDQSQVSEIAHSFFSRQMRMPAPPVVISDSPVCTFLAP